MPSRLISLNCPNCGGALELPNNLTIAHCIYCGNKILLDEEGVGQERRDLVRYIELCRVAVEAKNHTEVIEYCNRILKIDPQNIEAWINKAGSTFWLTTGAHNRYDEAIEYLNQASRIAPSDGRIEVTRKELTKQQALWYAYLGDMVAKTTGGPVEEMNYYLMASDYDPDNFAILERIFRVAKHSYQIDWSDKVRTRIKTFYSLKGEAQALYELKQDLRNAQSRKAGFNSKTSVGRFHQERLSEEVAWLQREITMLEKKTR